MRNRRLLLTLALACAPAAACSDITYTTPIAFEARLLNRTGDGVTGQVAAVTQHRNTQAGMDVTGAEATQYGWQINNGTCAAPGSIVGGRGNYPDVTTDADGRGTIERTFVAELLTTDRDYHAVIVDAATRQTIIACGELEQKFF
ncbi:MAG TPA: hypothetical protein VFR37_11925 [Longimicrobium sp.]|nr:hypothetical protein [Longimicrobium sp.]